MATSRLTLSPFVSSRILPECLPDCLPAGKTMRVKLTQELVDGARAQAGCDREILWDSDTKGFGLMVTSAGHRSFVVQYRSAGKSRRFTIKANLPLKSARNEAKAILGKVAKGGDPVLEKRRPKLEAANTLRSITEQYLKREEKKGELRSIGERRKSSSGTSIRGSEVVRSQTSSAPKLCACWTGSRTSMALRWRITSWLHCGGS